MSDCIGTGLFVSTGSLILDIWQDLRISFTRSKRSSIICIVVTTTLSVTAFSCSLCSNDNAASSIIYVVLFCGCTSVNDSFIREMLGVYESNVRLLQERGLTLNKCVDLS